MGTSRACCNEAKTKSLEHKAINLDRRAMQAAAVAAAAGKQVSKSISK